MPFLEPVTLTGDLVTLEPLQDAHHDELVRAASDIRLWELWYTSVPSPESMRADLADKLARQAAGEALPFTVRRTDTGAVVGMTTYLNVEAEVPRLEIGSTWTAASAQRTGVNAESKLLLLTHAFETWDCARVALRADARNARSIAAIRRLGAVPEGVLRSHRLAPDGSRGDSAYFSILPEEWPAVRAGLVARLSGDA